MAASLNDVIRVTVKQRQAAQDVLNVYHYQVVTLTGLDGAYLELVADWMDNEVHAAVRAAQSVQLSYQSMLVENVTNGIDFYERVYTGVTGTVATGQVMPPNVTMTFRLLRETLATRHGYKRYAGLSEDFQDNGVLVSGYTALMTAIEEALAADIQPAPAVVPLLAPVIVRKASDGTITAVNNIGAAQYRLIGTQNSRKIGRGS